MNVAELIKDVDIEPPASRYREILNAFIEVAVRTSETNDLDEVLHLVAKRICELVSVSRCSVFLRGDDGLLHGQVGHSPGQDMDDRIRRLVAGGERDTFTQQVIGGREPILVLDAQSDGRLDPRAVRLFGIRDILGVPLVFDDYVIGVLYLDNIADERLYTSEELEVAGTFARLIALAIRRAWTNGQLIRRTAIIERQRNLLERLSRIHAELTNAVLCGEDVPAIVRRLVNLVDKPVVVYDQAFNDVAFAAPPRLGCDRSPRLPAKALTSAWFLRQLGTLGPDRSSVVIPPSAGLELTARRALSPLRIDNALAGYLEIVEIGQQINTTDLKVLEYGATVVSLAMLSERRAIAAEGQAREGFLADLLDGRRDVASLARRAPLFGLDLDQPHAVLRVQFESTCRNERSRAQQRELVLGAITRGPGVPCPVSASLPGADVFVLGPLMDVDAAGFKALRNLFETAFQELQPTIGVRHAALSSVCQNPEDFAIANAELTQTIPLLEALGRRGSVSVPSDFRMIRMVTGEGRADHALRFAIELVKPLIDHDDDADGDLVSTLRAFLGCGGHIRRTATHLGVHENTVRYRLGKIRSVSAIDPDELDDLMDARFALQVLDLSADERRDGPHKAITDSPPLLVETNNSVARTST